MKKTEKFVKYLEDVYGPRATMSEKMYWTVLLTVLGSALLLLVSGLIWEGYSESLLIPAVLVPLVLVFLYMGYRTLHYSGWYMIFCIVFGALLIPVSLFIDGTLLNKSVILSLSAVMAAALNIRRKNRKIAFGLILGTNLLVMGFLYARDFAAIGLQGVRLIFVFLLLSFAFLFVISEVIDGYGETEEFLNRHLDVIGIRTLMKSRGEGDRRTPTGELFKTAVLFADISNFTMISETMKPELVARYLNEFFDVSDKCIHKNGGVLDKFMGDCAMAYWVDEDGSGKAAFQACRAALGIREQLNNICEYIYENYGCELVCSIGINYGDSIVGDVGSVDRKDFTVIGDAVNISARLESIAPGGTIYISKSVAEIVHDTMEIHHVPKKVVLKGKSAPVDIFTLDAEEIVDRGQMEVVLRQKSTTGFILHVCGSRGSFSISGKRYEEFGGETSCYVLKRGDYALIVDCGSGLQRARELLSDCRKIDILLTHLHYDHIIGLLDWSIFPSDAELHFYGNFDGWLGKDSINQFLRPPYWPVNLSRGEMTSTAHGQEYVLNEDVRVRFYNASHPNAACVLVINIQNRRICVMADCENPGDLPDAELRGAEILIFDGMYEDKYYSEHIGWGHSTWEKGVGLAMDKEVDRLVISHHNTRNSDEKLRGMEKMAQEIYPATTFAKAGDRFPI